MIKAEKMFTVRVEEGFAAAHFLSEYEGKCERLHGHNYLVRAYARGAELGKGGMLLDFTAFRRALKEAISEFDHRNLNDFPEFGNCPSAERIARAVYKRLKALLPGAPLSAVEVFESPGSMARYEEGE